MSEEKQRSVAEIAQGIIDQHSGWISNPKAYRQFGNMGEDIRTALRAERDRAEKAERQLAEFSIKEGPLNSEHWSLDKLMEELSKWKSVASGQTCVSFECLCFGASSLWHKTHKENFRKIDRKPMELSRWVLDKYGSLKDDFPAQVLQILKDSLSRAEKAEARIRELEAEVDEWHKHMIGLIESIEQPEMKGCKVLFLWFPTDEDRDEVLAAIQQAKPNMEARKL